MEERLLSCAEMSQADAQTIESGVEGVMLMAEAGIGVAEAIVERFSTCPVVVLCGPGNNGGDGFVVARRLLKAGWPVRVALLGERSALSGDAAHHADLWQGDVAELSPHALKGAALVVDAVFGAGLARPLEGQALATIEALAEMEAPVVAVDLPSGVNGDTGQVLGAAPQCALTVTFCRRKTGHLLLPGRALCGETVVVDIGIPDSVVDALDIPTVADTPDLWLDALPQPMVGGHKYDRGHGLILGGTEMTGAARLAALAARRIGAGLVTIACSPSSFPIYATGHPGTLVKPLEGEGAFLTLLRDPKKTAVLLGPGLGLGESTREAVLAVLRARKPCVLDADALSVFSRNPYDMFFPIDAPCVMTPHAGEFARLFADIPDDLGKLERARQAAKRAKAVIVFKGGDTVIAAPDGRAAICENAPPTLATAGTGDVLAGMILGLMSQGMSAFGAALAGVWMHAQAAAFFGPGLIAEDLPDQIPDVLTLLAEDEAVR